MVNKYQNKTSNDCRVSNLPENQLNELIKQCEIKLLKSLRRYMSVEQINEYITGDNSLIYYGVCTGMLDIVNLELQTINENICILDTDTFTKFIEDIRRDF